MDPFSPVKSPHWSISLGVGPESGECLRRILSGTEAAGAQAVFKSGLSSAGHRTTLCFDHSDEANSPTNPGSANGACDLADVISRDSPGLPDTLLCLILSRK